MHAGSKQMFLHTKAKVKQPEQDPTYGLFDEQELPARSIYVGIDRSVCGSRWHTRVRDLDKPWIWERDGVDLADLDVVLVDELSALVPEIKNVCLISDQPAVAHWLRLRWGHAGDDTLLAPYLRLSVPGLRAILLRAPGTPHVIK